MNKLLLLTLVAAPARTGFEFPDGIPVSAAEVTFYHPTHAYQVKGGGLHDRRSFPTRNANLEFPWKTGGMDKSTNGQSWVFYRFPPQSKLVWWTEGVAREDGDRLRYSGYIRWRYPHGMLFGEVLAVDGKAFEVRLMTRGERGWDFKIYRPYTSAAEIGIASRPSFVRLRNKHQGRVVDEVSVADEVELDRDTVQAILSRPFRDVTGVPWSKHQGHIAYAPSASVRGQLVPVNYQGTHFGAQTCVKCHDTVGKDVEAFDRGRQWGGNVRGSDGVFSFSPFDPECVSRSESSRPVRFRHDIPLVRR